MALPLEPVRVRSTICSGGVEHPLSEQVQLGPTIHLAFEELEPRHLPSVCPLL